MAWPPDPIAADVNNETLAADVHPGLHNELAEAINDLVDYGPAPLIVGQVVVSTSTADAQVADAAKTHYFTHDGAVTFTITDAVLAVDGWNCNIVADNTDTVVTVDAETGTPRATPSAVTEDRYSWLYCEVRDGAVYVTGRGVEP